MQYLVRRTTYFVDPHGTPDFGGSELYVSQTIDHDPDKFYQFDEPCEEWELSGSEDGYNSEAEAYEYLEIEDDAVDKVKKIIKKYNKLNKLFDR